MEVTLLSHHNTLLLQLNGNVSEMSNCFYCKKNALKFSGEEQYRYVTKLTPVAHHICLVAFCCVTSV